MGSRYTQIGQFSCVKGPDECVHTRIVSIIFEQIQESATSPIRVGLQSFSRRKSNQFIRQQPTSNVTTINTNNRPYLLPEMSLYATNTAEAMHHSVMAKAMGFDSFKAGLEILYDSTSDRDGDDEMDDR